jgi:hypothetical protein
MDAEEVEWSKVFGNDNFLSRPRHLRDLNTDTVTLSRSLFVAGVRIEGAGALHDWHLDLLRAADVISGIKATRDSVQNDR